MISRTGRLLGAWLVKLWFRVYECKKGCFVGCLKDVDIDA